MGSGDQASGVTGTELIFGAAATLTGLHSLYGSTFRQTSGAMQFIPATTGTGDAVNCLLQSSSTGNAPINLGSSTNVFDNIYNCDISHTTTTNQVTTSFNFNTAERLTVAAATPTAFINSAVAGMAIKDISFFGVPSQSDIRWSSAAAVGWKLYRPRWSGASPKFTTFATSVGQPAVANAAVEYWRYDVKTLDGATGASVPSIPVKLTDAIGNVLVNQVTGNTGELVFGSGLGLNMVPVMDHYVTGNTTYTQRHRSPFLVEINIGASANLNFPSQRYYMNWPGYETVTASAGSFEDVGDTIWMRPAGGTATTWTEAILP